MNSEQLIANPQFKSINTENLIDNRSFNQFNELKSLNRQRRSPGFFRFLCGRLKNCQ